MSITRYDLDANADGYFDDPFMKVREQGKFILHSDYAALLARHNALVEAVAWLRECEDCDQWAFEEFWVYDDELAEICAAARAEVDRLIANETEPTG